MTKYNLKLSTTYYSVFAYKLTNKKNSVNMKILEFIIFIENIWLFFCVPVILSAPNHFSVNETQ